MNARDPGNLVIVFENGARRDPIRLSRRAAAKNRARRGTP